MIIPIGTEKAFAKPNTIHDKNSQQTRNRGELSPLDKVYPQEAYS